MKGQPITPKIKAAVINDVMENSMTLKAVSAKHKIGYTTASTIITSYKKNGNKINMADDSKSLTVIDGASTPNQTELQSLRNQIKQLKREKEILKSAIIIVINDRQ